MKSTTHERPDREYGSETGSLPQRCIVCGKWFEAPTGYGIYCRICRVDVINALPLRRSQYGPAYLDCCGTPSCGSWALHTFARLEEVEDPARGRVCYRVWYECSHCGTMRLFGLQDRR